LDSTENGSSKLRRNIVAYIPKHMTSCSESLEYSTAHKLCHIAVYVTFTTAIFGTFLGDYAINICKICLYKLSLISPRPCNNSRTVTRICIKLDTGYLILYTFLQ
jgi:hypothetical protein